MADWGVAEVVDDEADGYACSPYEIYILTEGELNEGWEIASYEVIVGG